MFRMKTICRKALSLNPSKRPISSGNQTNHKFGEICKSRSLGSLDFLRSGEKDIHAFAESRLIGSIVRKAASRLACQRTRSRTAAAKPKLVAADVRRLTSISGFSQSLLTSAATEINGAGFFGVLKILFRQHHERTEVESRFLSSAPSARILPGRRRRALVAPDLTPPPRLAGRAVSRHLSRTPAARRRARGIVLPDVLPHAGSSAPGLDGPPLGF
jgi:hypothetical protein